LKIKEAASRLNTTPRTIRFYEEKGLIQPEKGENDYRYYNEADLWKLQTILALREVGMSTSKIKRTLQDENEVRKYLNMQRSALYEELLEIKDMITTLDQMVEQPSFSHEDMFTLANHLRDVKQKRKNWEDQWNFDSQAEDYDTSLKKSGFRFNVHEFYDEALASAVGFVKPADGETGTRHGHFLALPLMDEQAHFIVTSYALHHLTDEEKLLALQEMDRVLDDGGRIAIADLMFENEEQKEVVMKRFEEEGNTEAIFAINDEYYGLRSQLSGWLERHGYRVEVKKLSDILHVVYAVKV